MEKILKPHFPRYLFSKLISSVIFATIFISIGILSLRYESFPFIRVLLSSLEIISEPGNIPAVLSTTFLVISSIAFLLAFYIIITLSIHIIIYKSISYTITSKIIKDHKTLLNEIKTTVPFEQITNIQYTKTWILDTLFNTGTLYIFTSGSNSYDIKLDALKSPEKIYQLVNAQLGYQTSETINENGKLEENNKNTLEKRIKPVAIFPTIIGLITPPVVLMFTGFIPLLIGIIYFALDSSNLLVIIPFIIISISILVLWLGGVAMTYQSYKRRYYDFYKDKIEFYDGFLTKRKATIAMERITNIDNSQTFIGRLFDLHTIKIETAGSSGAEISISFVRDGDSIVKELKEVLKIHGRN